MSDAFSPDYATARAKFLEAAGAAKAAQDSYANPTQGPNGEDLATDTAWFGPADADAVLVLVSGTHGAEGHCGSGAQIDWIRRGEYAQLPANTSALIVHAINPHGFAWSRRVTEENVDLNRNWVDFNALPANDAYVALTDAICPADWSEDSQKAANAQLMAYARDHGWMAMQQAITGGQYTHPKGVFYGGIAPTWANVTLTSIIRDRLSAARHVAFIDYHTGLGPVGYAEPIVSALPGSPELSRAQDWYGWHVTCPNTGESASADIVGDWLAAAPALLPNAQVTGMALEYGTQDSVAVLSAVRASAWLHAHGDPRSERGEQIRQQVRDAFYVDTDTWKGMVLGQSLASTRQALAGLKRAMAQAA